MQSRSRTVLIILSLVLSLFTIRSNKKKEKEKINRKKFLISNKRQKYVVYSITVRLYLIETF